MRLQKIIRYLLFLAAFWGRANAQTSCVTYCPDGWKTLTGGGDHCYIFPPSPITKRNFWDTQAYCQSLQPTSYIITLNNLAENFGGGIQALGYFMQYISQLGSLYIWLGGYYSGGKWYTMDGTPWSYSCIIPPIFPWDKKPKDGDCVYVDPISTLVTWSFRPCTDSNGATACEMSPLKQCGVTTPPKTTPAPYVAPKCDANAFADFSKSLDKGYLGVDTSYEVQYLTGLDLQSCSIACMYYAACSSFDFDASTGDCRMLRMTSQLVCAFVDDPDAQWQHYDMIANSIPKT